MAFSKFCCCLSARDLIVIPFLITHIMLNCVALRDSSFDKNYARYLKAST